MHFHLFPLIKQDRTISISNNKPLKFVDQFTYLGSNISSKESDVSIRIGNTWTSINRLSNSKKFDLSDKIKREFFQTVAVSVLLYGCTA